MPVTPTPVNARRVSGLGLCIAAFMSLSLGCAELPDIKANVCGNAVIEENEDCDTFADPGKSCRAPGVAGECHFDCRTNADGRRAECPPDMGCASDGVCRPPTGAFEKPVNFALGVSSWLTTADFDGDGRLDVISTEVADALRQARFRIHYFDADAKLQETRTFPRVVSRPIARRFMGDDAAEDLVFSNGLIGMVPGRSDRALIPEAFSSYVLPGTRLQAVSVRADVVGQVVALAIFSDLGEGPGVYLPSLDDSKLSLSVPLRLSFEDLLVQSSSANVVTSPDSPCYEVIYAFRGDDSVHMLDLCEPGSVAFGAEIAWRERVIEQVFYLPGGAKVTTVPQTADVDGDGQLDVLVGSGNQTFVSHGDRGKLEEEASELLLPALNDGTEFHLSPPLASGDITGDGVIDFVMPTGILASYTSLVDGRLGYFPSLENSATPWSMAVMADLNGNDLPDVIAATEGSPGLSFVSGTGGPFQNQTRLTTPGSLRFMSVGDFDGDRMQDVAYVQSGPSKDGDDSLAIAFGQRDAFPLAEQRIAEVAGVRQLGSATQQAGSGLFTVSREETGGVTRSKFTLFDGSPDRLPFAPYSLVTFAVDGSLKDSLARVLTAGHFTASGASDLLAVAGDPTDARLWSLWLVPEIGAAERPPQRLQTVQVPDDALGVTFNREGGQLSAAVSGADLDGDGLDEIVLLMPKGVANDGCYLLSFEIDAAAGVATREHALTFDTPCPDPELATTDLNGDGAPDLLVLIGDPKIGPRRLRLLFNDQRGGFSLDQGALVGVEGRDIRGVSAFTRRATRLAFVTEEGLYLARSSLGTSAFDEVTRLQDFVEARSVVVTDPNGDGVEDIAVADAAGVWLVRAELR